jgi:integrase
MPKQPLSATAIKDLSYMGKQEAYFDTRLAGFGVRVSAGSKTYFAQAKVKGRVNASGRPLEIKESLGRVPDDNDAEKLKTVKERARRIIADAGQGITPEDREREAEDRRKEEARLKKIEDGKDITLGDLFDRYIGMKTAKGKLKVSTSQQYRMSMETHFADWLDRPAREITSSMVETRHINIGKGKTQVNYSTKKGNDRKGERGGKGAADLAMRVLRAVYSYGIVAYDDVFYKNPVCILSKTDGWYKLDRRESYISTEQLQPWFEGLNALEATGTRTLLVLGMFTGARKNELARLKWSDLDLDNGVGTFRETKNGKTLIVPIAEYAVNILKEHQESFYTGPDGYVFPSYGLTGHIRDPRRALEKITERSGIKFTLHDFRRTFLTFCNAVGVPVWTQKRLVNHAKPDDVTQGYVQHEIEILRRDVETVAHYILSNAGIIDGCKVISLAERRKTA